MTEKSAIVRELGEQALLLPTLLGNALTANDRLKLRLTILQEASSHARHPEHPPQSFAGELRAAGLDGSRYQAMLAGVHAVSAGQLIMPGVNELIAGIADDLEAMLAPLDAAGTAESQSFRQRKAALVAGIPPVDGDRIAIDQISSMTSARHGASDSVHLLVMDLHKAINRLASETAAETIDGARAHQVTPDDRRRIKAFMAGVHRTARLAFGHPGLGTTAAHVSNRLTIQNDIGTTDAHVLVVHVEARSAEITYTDVHRRRALFFMSLFESRAVEWTPLAQRQVSGIGEGAAFHLVTGRFNAADSAALDGFLDFLGSRLVFLIDWNKARKALQSFVSKDFAVGILTWAAEHDLGHRAFLELGGSNLVYDAIRRGGSSSFPYGARFEQVLGPESAVGFLRGVLRHASEGMAAGQSTRLIRDEVQADLAQLLETAESATLMTLVRHLGITRMLACRIDEALAGSPHLPGDLSALRLHAKRMEGKADQLTVSARETCARVEHAAHLRQVVDAIENTTDTLDECAFHLSLMPAGSGAAGPDACNDLAKTVVDSISALVRALEATARLPEGHRVDAVDALQAIESVVVAERRADDAERKACAAVMAQPCADPRVLVLNLEIVRKLETATDYLAHAALSLRDRVMEELSA